MTIEEANDENSEDDDDDEAHRKICIYEILMEIKSHLDVIVIAKKI